MPLIVVRALEGALDRTQKQELLARLTEAVVAVQGEAVRPHTWVLIDEMKDEQLAVGGKVWSGAAVRALRGPEPPAGD